MYTQYNVQRITLRSKSYKQLTQQLEELKKQARRERKIVTHSFTHINKAHYAVRVVLTHKNVAKFAA